MVKLPHKVSLIRITELQKNTWKSETATNIPATARHTMTAKIKFAFPKKTNKKLFNIKFIYLKVSYIFFLSPLVFCLNFVS